MSINSAQNTGLSWRFQVTGDSLKTYDKWVDDGFGGYVQQSVTVPSKKFNLFGGVDKANDNITMMLGFIGWFRIYHQDFVPDLLDLVQKPTSFVYNLKTIITAKLQSTIVKYIPEIQLEGINMVYDYRDTKLFTISVNYGYGLKDDENFTVVRFLQI